MMKGCPNYFFDPVFLSELGIAVIYNSTTLRQGRTVLGLRILDFAVKQSFASKG
jgi:hypothetical protein